MRPDATKVCDGGQNFGKRGAHLIDPWLKGRNPLIEIADHEARGIEHDHHIFGERRWLGFGVNRANDDEKKGKNEHGKQAGVSDGGERREHFVIFELSCTMRGFMTP
jgi:hypothetical protein